MDERTEQPDHGVSFREASRFWTKLGFINFGGPTGQIAIMHDELVERRRWISNARFLHALNYCMLLPGPEAQQLAVYVGWLLHRVKGGIVAGLTFIIPAFFVMLGLSYVYAVHGDVEWVDALFYGLGAAVVGIVAAAVIRIGKKALRNGVLYLVAVAGVRRDLLLPRAVPAHRARRGSDRSARAALGGPTRSRSRRSTPKATEPARRSRITARPERTRA